MEVNFSQAQKRYGHPGNRVWTELVQTFRSLANPNYRTYFGGSLISQIGSWMQITAISWLVYSITDSAFFLGLAGFLRQSPLLLFGLTAGWLADHFDRRKILLTTKTFMLLQASCLAFFTLTGTITIWHILVLACLAGSINAFDMPSKQAFTYNLVKNQNMINAVSLNTMSFHFARATGPLLAALVVKLIGEGQGEGWCFAINAITFLFIIRALLVIRRARTVERRVSAKSDSSLKEAVSFVLKKRKIRRIMILGAISSLMCMQYIVLLPVFAQELGSRMGGFGILMSSAALGSFCAAMFLANRGKTGELLHRGVVFAAFGFALMLMVFSLSDNFYLSMILVAIVGFCSTTQMSGSNALIQLEVDDDMRGKVMSMWMMNITGLGPIGGLIMGWAATQVGAPLTMAFCSSLAAIIPLVFILRGKMTDSDSKA